ncbi:MAG: MBL fold metallo-hydrolase [Candidatus Caenarcaniphilales bacterium]|nr:MBL fold metallo-hydrolase [Candidatus Caenarcaniphilales bacterium]
MIETPIATTSQEEMLFQLLGGYDKNYTYIIGCKTTKELALVDCAAPFKMIDNKIQELVKEGYKLTKIFLTHAHHDHVFSLKEIFAKYIPLVLAHPLEFERVKRLSGVEIKNFIEDRIPLQLGEERLLPIYTPGHQNTCFCFLWRDKIFTGDTLFIDGCGRCNFPESNIYDQLESMKLIANELDDTLEVLPGHAYGSVDKSTIGREKQDNKYLVGLQKHLITPEIEKYWIELRS